MNLTNRLFNLQLIIEALIDEMVEADITTYDKLNSRMQKRAKELQAIIDELDKVTTDPTEKTESSTTYNSGSDGRSIFTFGRDTQGEA